jgi:phosphoadenosine phosphosulfate reductase
MTAENSKTLAVLDEALEINNLNKIFARFNYRERIEKIYEHYSVDDVLFTSSFGTKSVFLLWLISQIKPEQEIVFIDTTYHFQETLYFKNKLIKQFNLKVKDVLPDPIQNRLTTDENWWVDHPNMCCTVNKIVPLDSVIGKNKVWISGLMAYQTPHRANLKIFEDRGDILKFHPLIDIQEAEYLYQKGRNRLPDHPLSKEGYGSVGCVHCTNKGEDRSGRWASKGKTECGLHTSFYYKKGRKK